MGQDQDTKNNFWKMLDLAWTLGYTIAIPIIIFGFAGAYADKKFDTSPIFLITGIVLSIIATVMGIYKKIKNLIN